jgi:hypothetical protein
LLELVLTTKVLVVVVLVLLRQPKTVQLVLHLT